MRSRDAWLAVFAATLGVSEEACKRDGKDAPAAARDTPSATASSAIVAATAPSASADPAPSASVVASASASASAVASATPVPKPSPTELQLLAVLGSANNPNFISNAACGAVVPNNNLQNLGRINPSCGATANNTVRGPTADVQVRVQNGAAGDDAVVVRLRPKFRSCANRGLSQDPNMQGKLVISVTIAATGDVTATAIAQNSGLSESVAQCMSRGARYAAFSAGAPHTVQIFVTQVKQN